MTPATFYVLDQNTGLVLFTGNYVNCNEYAITNCLSIDFSIIDKADYLHGLDQPDFTVNTAEFANGKFIITEYFIDSIKVASVVNSRKLIGNVWTIDSTTIHALTDKFTTKNDYLLIS